MIKHYKLFIITGAVIFLLPFMGIPQSFKSTIMFFVGLILLITGLLYRNWNRVSTNGDDSVYAENGHTTEEVEELAVEEVVEPEETPGSEVEELVVEDEPEVIQEEDDSEKEGEEE